MLLLRRITSSTASRVSLEANPGVRAAELAVLCHAVQQKFVMERLIARLFHAANTTRLLKGPPNAGRGGGADRGC